MRLYALNIFRLAAFQEGHAYGLAQSTELLREAEKIIARQTDVIRDLREQISEESPG